MQLIHELERTRDETLSYFSLDDRDLLRTCALGCGSPHERRTAGWEVRRGVTRQSRPDARDRQEIGDVSRREERTAEIRISVTRKTPETDFDAQRKAYSALRHDGTNETVPRPPKQNATDVVSVCGVSGRGGIRTHGTL
jgi:hypothetical protein